MADTTETTSENAQATPPKPRQKAPRKSRAKPGAKRGRPQKTISVDALRALARIGCPVSEMAIALGIHERTLERRNYAALITDAIVDRNVTLRRAQFRAAIFGKSERMMMLLGNLWLGQKPAATPVEHSGTVTTIQKRVLKIERFT